MEGGNKVRAPRGYTAVELIVVLAVIGVVLSLALPRAQLALDRESVRAASSDAVTVIGTARTLALASHQAVAVDIAGDGTLRIRRGEETFMTRAVGQLHGVDVVATRDSLAYDWHGLGRGAANLSIVIRRRSAADTVFVSRLGRVR